jgi:hypothetical protein
MRVDVAVVAVELERGLQLAQHLVPGRIAVLAISVTPGLAERARLPGVRMRIFGVESNGAIEQALRGCIIPGGRSMVQYLTGEDALVGGHVVGLLA